MRQERISYSETGYFSNLITDYLAQKPELEAFYNRFPDADAFKAQIDEKLEAYPDDFRKPLHNALEDQYKGVSISEATRTNLDALTKPGSLTVVTGHQLNLFTGPLYFHYKIASTLILCRRLRELHPDKSFVPVYWMASEDHDFEEISYFNCKGKEFRWNREAGGAVGRMQTKGLEELAKAFGQELGPGKAADRLRKLFKEAYLKTQSLSAATRYLVNALFGEEGLVILDADDPGLKRLFIPYMRADLRQKRAFSAVSTTIEALKELPEGVAPQVSPREINLFYLSDHRRDRIVENNGRYSVLDTGMVFTEEQLLKELETYPERFSPNVITRPLYQEVILPNLCYIGGGGELAYWLELAQYFRESDVPFPILLLRNSAIFISEKQETKARKLHLSLPELFLDQNDLINRKIRQISNIDIDFTPQRDHLKKQFEALYRLAEQTDQSFMGAVKAQEVRQLKGLDHLEKRLLKAQKRKLKDHVNRLTALQNELFPGGSLQERNRNFAELYLEFGETWVPQLIESFDPLDLRFSIFLYPQ
jgi:bacillithiol biosynthesis cysteine-adding enzyme BshC